jgi:hypothetical protein
MRLWTGKEVVAGGIQQILYPENVGKTDWNLAALDKSKESASYGWAQPVLRDPQRTAKVATKQSSSQASDGVWVVKVDVAVRQAERSVKARSRTLTHNLANSASWLASCPKSRPSLYMFLNEFIDGIHCRSQTVDSMIVGSDVMMQMIDIRYNH